MPPDLNLEVKPKRLNASESGWPNVWRWYKQTSGQNVVQQATSMTSNPWWQLRERAQALPFGSWWTNWLSEATSSFVTIWTGQDRMTHKKQLRSQECRSTELLRGFCDSTTPPSALGPWRASWPCRLLERKKHVHSWWEHTL